MFFTVFLSVLSEDSTKVIKLRTTPPLFKAYEEVYNALEAACPDFYRSDQYFNVSEFNDRTNYVIMIFSSTCWATVTPPPRWLTAVKKKPDAGEKDSAFSAKLDRFLTGFFGL